MGTKTPSFWDSPKSYKTEAISDANAGNNTIVAAVAGVRLKVYAIHFNVSGNVNMIWVDGTVGDLTGDMNFNTREGYTNAVTPPAFLLATTAGEALIMNLSGAVAVDGWIAYWDDDAT